MGIEVKVHVPAKSLGLQTALRRGLQAAGVEILAASDALAPTEPKPRHGVHLTETGFVRVVPGVNSDSVVVGYEAFWAWWQNEDLTYHHPHGGQAKFLDTAMLGGAERAGETIAAVIRAELAT